MFRSPEFSFCVIDISAKRSLSTNKHKMAFMSKARCKAANPVTTKNWILTTIFNIQRCDAIATFQKGEMFNLCSLPMQRNLPQPVDARLLERHVGIKAAGHGLLNEGLLLLLEQLDEPLLRADIASRHPVNVGEEGGDGALFGLIRVWNIQVICKPST